MVDFDVEIVNLKAVGDYLNDMPEETFKDAKEVFQKAVVDADAQVKSNFGSSIQSRSGSLRRSLGMQVSGTSIASLSASIFGAASVGGSALKYTLAQEFGAQGPNRIVAKRAYRKVPGGPYLNIPLAANKTAAGVMRMNARQVFSQGGYIAQSKSKNWIVFLKGEPMFVLKKSVELKPRLGMVKAAEDQVPTILSKLQDMIGDY